MKKMLFIMTMILNLTGQSYAFLVIPNSHTQRDFELLDTIKRDAQALLQLAQEINFTFKEKELFIDQIKEDAYKRFQENDYHLSLYNTINPIENILLTGKTIQEKVEDLVYWLNQTEPQIIFANLNEFEKKCILIFLTIKEDLLSRDGLIYLDVYGLLSEAQEMVSLGSSIRWKAKELQPQVTQELISLQEAARHLTLDPEGLAEQFPDAHFCRYENKVGNSKKVILVKTHDQKTFVLKKVNAMYPQAYKALAKKQHRPDAYFFTAPSNSTLSEPSNKQLVTIGAFEFMGFQGIDPYNDEQLKQLARLGIIFTLDNDVFDPNAGNIVVKDNILYYIDVGLTYSSKDTMCFNLLENIQESMDIAVYFLSKTTNPSWSAAYKIFTKLMQAYKQELLHLDQSIMQRFQEDYQQSLTNTYPRASRYTFNLETIMRAKIHIITNIITALHNDDLQDKESIQELIESEISSMFDIIRK